MAFYEFVCAQKKQAQEEAAGERFKLPKFNVLEMSHDRSTKPVMVPITPDLNTESFLEDWCRRWCDSHGYKLVEVQDDDGILRVKKVQHHPSGGEQDL
jgi:hypothetical protein